MSRHIRHVTIIMLYFLSILIVGFWDTGARAKDSSTQKPHILRTIESHGAWKVTLSSRPFPFTVRRPDGNDVQLTNTLCYVDVLPVDSNTPRRVWQRNFPDELRGPTAPRSFALGPVDEHRFCLSFIEGLRLYSFILDSRSRLTPKEGAPVVLDLSKPSETSAIEEDPNSVFLEKVIDEKKYRDLAIEGLSIAGVCGFGESRVIHLLGQNKQGVVLRCQPGEKKLTCQVFQLSEVGR